MSEASILFTLDGVNLTLQCKTEDKMKDICKSYSTKINKNMDSLLFLYEENKVNFDLSFKEQTNVMDRNNHKMKIMVSEYDGKNNQKLNMVNEDIKIINEKIKNLLNDSINDEKINNNIKV